MISVDDQIIISAAEDQFSFFAVGGNSEGTEVNSTIAGSKSIEVDCPGSFFTAAVGTDFAIVGKHAVDGGIADELVIAADKGQISVGTSENLNRTFGINDQTAFIHLGFGFFAVSVRLVKGDCSGTVQSTVKFDGFFEINDAIDGQIGVAADKSEALEGIGIDHQITVGNTAIAAGAAVESPKTGTDDGAVEFGIAVNNNVIVDRVISVDDQIIISAAEDQFSFFAVGGNSVGIEVDSTGSGSFSVEGDLAVAGSMDYTDVVSELAFNSGAADELVFTADKSQAAVGAAEDLIGSGGINDQTVWAHLGFGFFAVFVLLEEADLSVTA